MPLPRIRCSACKLSCSPPPMHQAHHRQGRAPHRQKSPAGEPDGAFLLLEEFLQTRQDYKLVAPVFSTTILIARSRARRTLFAVAHDPDARRIDSALGEITADSSGTTLTQSHVVFVRPAVVGVAFDSNLNRSISL